MASNDQSTQEPSDNPVRSRRYSNEDLTPTSTLELRGWYSYGMAAEVFAVCGIGSFLPVTLEQLARENGVLWSDRSVPCFKPGPSDPAAGNSNDGARKILKRLLQEAFIKRSVDGREADQCVVHVLGVDVTTASFAMYTFSAAVFFQALVLVSFGSFADHGMSLCSLVRRIGVGRSWCIGLYVC